MDRLKWGVLGCSLVAEDFVRSMAFCQHRQQVVGVAANELQRAEEFLRTTGLKYAKAYRDYTNLLQDPEIGSLSPLTNLMNDRASDVVFIDVPNDAHITWTLKAAAHGKHVVCEKPLALNTKQVREIVEKAQQTQIFLMESFWSRCFPAWLKIREVIQSRELGRLKVFHCNLGSGPMPDVPRDLTTGEIPLLGIGVYPICLALYAFDDQKPERVTAVGQKDEKGDRVLEVQTNSNAGIDRWANITLEFANNRHALVYYNSDSYSPTSAWLSFEFGQIQIPNFFWSTERVITMHGPLNSGRVRNFEFPLNDPTKYNFSNAGGLRYQTDHIFEMIRDGRFKVQTVRIELELSGNTASNIMSWDSSIQLAEVMEEIRVQLEIRFVQD